MAMDFPNSPVNGQLYPPTVAAGQIQYEFNGIAWTTKGVGPAGAPTSAANVSFVPAGSITSTNVQAALVELDTKKAPLAGATFTGPVVLAADPTASLGAATKQYVDNHTTTLTGAVTGSGAGSITTTLASGIVAFANMAAAAIATTAQYFNNTAQKILTTDQVWAAAIYSALTDVPGGTVTVDFSQGVNFWLTMTASGNRTLAIANAKNGQSGSLFIQQSPSGNGTITWSTSWKFAGGTKPTLTTGGSTYDIVSYQIINSGFICCSFAGNFG